MVRMHRPIIFASALLGSCNDYTSSKNEQPNPHLQIKISGNGLASIKSEIVSKGKQEFLMFGAPAQSMFFKNTDTINYLFPIGKKDTIGHLDTTSIARGETLIFNIKISENKSAHITTSAAKPLLRVELLADNKMVQFVQLPSKSRAGRKSTTSDSTTTLTLQTSSL